MTGYRRGCLGGHGLEWSVVFVGGVVFGAFLPALFRSSSPASFASARWGDVGFLERDASFIGVGWLEEVVIGAQWRLADRNGDVSWLVVGEKDGEVDCVPAAIVGRLLEAVHSAQSAAAASETLWDVGGGVWRDKGVVDDAVLGGVGELGATCVYLGGLLQLSKGMAWKPEVARMLGLDEGVGGVVWDVVFGEEGSCLPGALLRLVLGEVSGRIRARLRLIGREVGEVVRRKRLYGVREVLTGVMEGQGGVCGGRGVVVEEVGLQGMGQSMHRRCHKSTPWRCVTGIPRLYPHTTSPHSLLSSFFRPFLEKNTSSTSPLHPTPPDTHPTSPFLWILHVPKTGGTSLNVQLPILFPSFVSCNSWRSLPFNGAQSRAKRLATDLLTQGADDCDLFSTELPFNESMKLAKGWKTPKGIDRQKWEQWLRYFNTPGDDEEKEKGDDGDRSASSSSSSTPSSTSSSTSSPSSPTSSPTPSSPSRLRPLLVLTLNRDPVQRTISFVRHHLPSSHSLSKAVSKSSLLRRALRSPFSSFSDPGASSTHLFATERALNAFWQGITDFSALSYCLLAFQTRHPAWKSSFCDCHTAGLPLSVNKRPQHPQEDAMSTQALKDIFAKTAKERIGHALLTSALWERAEQLRAAFPQVDIECLALRGEK